ncbi:hypothetical protein [Aquimarina sp. MMG016]|nr:hypothetical protein [Aquimarina sp. MMG016]MBQ4820631.1 hypothetical protein [Aquimarina sp. MMG016]
MKKDILNLEGVKILNKEAQKTVNGGYDGCDCQITDMPFFCPSERCD